MTFESGAEAGEGGSVVRVGMVVGAGQLSREECEGHGDTDGQYRRQQEACHGERGGCTHEAGHVVPIAKKY